MPSLDQSVARVVLDHSACARVFQKYRIDFCCRGERSVAQAASERGIDPRALLLELDDAINARAGDGGDPRELSNAALIAHIIGRHHEYLRKVLPFLLPLAAKVARVHGDHNPKLRVVDEVTRALAEDLEPHLAFEEESLFPAIMSGQPSDTISRSLATMHEEHLAVGTLLERLREAADDFLLPDWACNSYRTLFAELEALEGDILRHVHLENHVLMPRFAS